MPYNTRRGGNFGNPMSASAVGQRRPPVSNNFVHGGQLNLSNHGNYQNQQLRPPQQNFTNQQQSRATQQNKPPQQNKPQQGNQWRQFGQPKQHPQQQQPQQQQQQQQPQQQQQQQLPQLPQQPPQQQQQQTPPPSAPIVTPPVTVKAENVVKDQPPTTTAAAPQVPEKETEPIGNDEKKPRPFWVKNAGKISRKEKMRRRNKRLVKFLQPKNAVMVLNEMIGNSTYTLSENTDEMNGCQFKASVFVDGIEHDGYGKSKMGAKASAAETAIKYLVFKKLRAVGQTTNSIVGKIEDGEDVNMEEGGEEATLPWQHVASFALHKLFSTWDDLGGITDKLVTNVTTTDGAAGTLEKKPAKKMPPNPETMNPIMLLNQMMPHAQYIELSKAGNPPHVVFTYKCSANGQTFIGRGSNKKQAKKMCAFEACRTLLNVVYPPEMFTAHPQSSSNQNEAIQLP